MTYCFICHAELCAVDLQNKDGLSLQIEKKNLMSLCEMKMNSLVQEKIVVPAGSKVELSFLDCSADDLQLAATKSIGNTNTNTDFLYSAHAFE